MTEKIDAITFEALRDLMDVIEKNFPKHPRKFECQPFVDEETFVPGVAILLPWETLQDVQAVVGE